MPSLLRRLLLLLICALPLADARAADPSAPPPFQEGKDYARLPTPVPPAIPDQPEVVELFWYGCRHCYELEPMVQEWLKRKPAHVVFTQIAVAFGSNWEPGARAFYAAKALGVLDKVHQPLFEAIHRDQRNLTTEDALAVFFAEQGIDQDAFRKAYSSFQTETQLRRGNQLAQRFGVRGVPAVIVNGQYEVRSPRMFEVVDFLIARSAGPQG
jgi:protein dithiol oxidoreductase (disulfide-forming)